MEVPIIINIYNNNKNSSLFTCENGIMEKIYYFFFCFKSFKIATIISCILVNCHMVFSIILHILSLKIEKIVKVENNKPFITKKKRALILTILNSMKMIIKILMKILLIIFQDKQIEILIININIKIIIYII